jgi:hypothetical protein
VGLVRARLVSAQRSDDMVDLHRDQGRPVAHHPGEADEPAPRVGVGRPELARDRLTVGVCCCQTAVAAGV